MSVKGLTDVVEAAFPRIGQLRKGEEAKGGFGKELEWFRFVGDADVTKAFADAYGKQPQFIAPVFLPFDTPDEVFAVWKEAWTKSSMQHRCNGEMTTVIRKGAGFSTVPVACPGGCKLVGRLSVILPEVWRAGHIGYVTVHTGAVNDVLQIMALLKMVYETKQTLRGVAFQLRRVHRQISAPNPDKPGERMRVWKWLVQLEVSPDWARLQLEAAERASKMIEAPKPTVNKETGELDGEFVIDPEDQEGASGEDEPWTVSEEDVDAGKLLPVSEPTKVLPAANGGPGWGKFPAWTAKFKEDLKRYKVADAETVLVFGKDAHIGETMAYSDAMALVVAFAEHKAAQPKMV